MKPDLNILAIETFQIINDLEVHAAIYNALEQELYDNLQNTTKSN